MQFRFPRGIPGGQFLFALLKLGLEIQLLLLQFLLQARDRLARLGVEEACQFRLPAAQLLGSLLLDVA